MIKCIYHSKDLDGKCSGAIIKKVHPRCKMIGIDHGDDFPWHEITKKDTIYMVDFSRDNVEDMFKIEDSCKKFIWIDHHISSLRKMQASKKTLKHMHVDVTRAACEIVWTVMFPDQPVPEPVYLIGRYDIWDHTDPRTVPFQRGLASYYTGVDGPVWEEVFKDYKGFYSYKDPPGVRESFQDNIIDIGKRISSYQEGVDEWKMKFSASIEWEGLRFISLNNTWTGSTQFDSVWDEDKYDAVMVYFRTPKKKWEVHMYTQKEGIDVSTIAVKYGGGGHYNAAACIIDELPF